jgi:ribosome biogenesis GTPase / thiamine phosphate phosphatase
MNLELLGADTSVYRAFEPWAQQQLVLARVAAANRDRYRLITETADIDAEASGALWYRSAGPAAMPVTGDWVAARVINATEAIVEAVLPRRTFFSRRAAGRREEQQPIAANIDLVFLVSGLDGDFNPRRIERYLALSAESAAQAVIVLNKRDLCENLADRVTETRAVAAGAAIVTASTVAADGLDEVREHLAPGRTIALLGSSGVGKSSIVNDLLGEERLRTNTVREHDSRGRHTTTHRELIPLPEGGALIDTPGMRELQLWAGEDSIDQVFDDVAAIAVACRYRDCSHTEENGCAVRQAVDEGTLDPARLTSYRKLQGEARRHEALTNPLAALEQKRKWKIIHKAAREPTRTGNAGLWPAANFSPPPAAEPPRGSAAQATPKTRARTR